MIKTVMQTASAHAIEQAASWILRDEVVGLPTETVYGLAANACSAASVARIFEAKGRPQDNPLIVHIAKLEDLEKVAQNIPEDAYRLAEAFWPGPLTLILERAENIVPAVSGGLSSVGVRIPAHEAARKVIDACKVPLAAPSANCSGRPSPTTAAHVWDDLAGKIPFILDGGPSVMGVESTVLNLQKEAVVLRPGFITAEEIESVLGRPVRYAASVTKPLEEGKVPKSPGTKYTHYAPLAKLTLVEGSFAFFLEQARQVQAADAWALCFEGEEHHLPLPALSYGRFNDAKSQSAGLFAALRLLDEKGAKAALVRCETESEEHLAVYNRLLRAAAFRVVRP